jgi:hypothetical protein
LYLIVSDSLRRRESECCAKSVGIDYLACFAHECVQERREQWKALREHVLAEYESQAACVKDEDRCDDGASEVGQLGRLAGDCVCECLLHQE